MHYKNWLKYSLLFLARPNDVKLEKSEKYKQQWRHNNKDFELPNFVNKNGSVNE